MKIPLILKLKRQTHKDIAKAQDFIIEELYNSIQKAILHGGTAIWRCYNGNRFSDDIDVYIPKDLKKIEKFFKLLERRGFKIIKKRIKENSIYSELIFDRTTVRFEATFQTKKFILKEYETSESFFINIYTLSPEDLIIEKIQTYLKRNKIRDLYDILFLLNYTQNNKIQDYLKKLVENFIKPKDEEDLKSIIISGAIPDSKQLLENIKKWVK